MGFFNITLGALLKMFKNLNYLRGTVLEEIKSKVSEQPSNIFIFVGLPPCKKDENGIY